MSRLARLALATIIISTMVEALILRRGKVPKKPRLL
jgi:hypothetical protein